MIRTPAEIERLRQFADRIAALRDGLPEDSEIEALLLQAEARCTDAADQAEKELVEGMR